VAYILISLAALVGIFAAWWAMSKKETKKENSVQPMSATQETPKRHAIFLDLETTGLDPEHDRITEICVLRAVFGEKVHDGLATLINPGRSIPQQIVDLTGITDEMVKDKPGEEVLHQFLDYIDKDLVHAYNADFDMSFLRAAAKRLGRTFNNESLCVLELLREKHPNLRSYKLKDACVAFSINPDENAHRALGDTIRAIGIYSALCDHKQPAASYLRQNYFEDDDGCECAVYGHFNEAGECFYVRTVNDGQSEIPDKDRLWSFYTERMLGGQYEVRMLEDELSFTKALAYKEKVLKEHAKTLLNRTNPWRKYNAQAQGRYRELKAQVERSIESGRFAEDANSNEALAIYWQALKFGEEKLDLLLEDGLFGEVDRAYRKIHRCNCLLKALDRLTLVLCRERRYDEAAVAANDIFARYPGADSLAGAGKIRNRIAKGMSKDVSG
jgi:DNA polymerase III epsilon subunit family exonuclease